MVKFSLDKKGGITFGHQTIWKGTLGKTIFYAFGSFFLGL